MPVIKLHANLRNIAGKKEEIVEGSTLSKVIASLVEKFPPLQEAILEDGEVRENYLITINGRHYADLNQAINEGDIIAIFPPISGG